MTSTHAHRSEHAPQAAPAQAVYLLPLKDGGAPDVPGGYINMPPPQPDNPYIIRFTIEGASSICREGTLCVNVPDKGVPFKRNEYKEFK